MKASELLPQQPYLLRAFYEWLIDNQLTPYLMIDTTINGVIIPIKLIKNKQIVFNISPYAVINLKLNNDEVQFNAKFNGIPQLVVLPMAAILTIYAYENGIGTIFNSEIAYQEQVVLVDKMHTIEPKLTNIKSVINNVKIDYTHKQNYNSGSDTLRHKKNQPTLCVIK